jgi:hypothetical protein
MTMRLNDKSPNDTMTILKMTLLITSLLITTMFPISRYSTCKSCIYFLTVLSNVTFMNVITKAVVSKVSISLYHRYRMSLNRLLKVCYVPAISAVLIAVFSSFFAVAINSTNEGNYASSTRH